MLDIFFIIFLKIFQIDYWKIRQTVCLRELCAAGGGGRRGVREFADLCHLLV